MMTLKRILCWLPAILLVGMITVACKEKPKTEADALILSSSTLTDNAQLKNSPAQLGLSLTLSIDYPADYPNAEVLKNVRREMLKDYFSEPEQPDSVFETPRAVLESYSNDYKQFFNESESTYADVEDEESMYSSDPWYNNLKTTIRFNDQYLFSYTVSIDRYSGGAHGEKRYINSVVDLKNGKKITEDDLFTEKAKSIIVTMITDKIMKQNKLNSIEALADIGYFDLNEELNLNTNFYVTEKGLTYTFNEYEIAGYAVGTTEVFLDFSILSDYLKPGNPLAGLID
jgi:hypothetical protein